MAGVDGGGGVAVVIWAGGGVWRRDSKDLANCVHESAWGFMGLRSTALDFRVVWESVYMKMIVGSLMEYI